MVLLIVGLSAAVVGAYGPMLSPGFVQVSANLGITVEVLSQATAWLILTIGLSLFITNPLAKVYGRRPIYILAIIIMFATSVWGAAVTTYNSFLASRIIGGIGMVSSIVATSSWQLSRVDRFVGSFYFQWLNLTATGTV